MSRHLGWVFLRPCRRILSSPAVSPLAPSAVLPLHRSFLASRPLHRYVHPLSDFLLDHFQERKVAPRAAAQLQPDGTFTLPIGDGRGTLRTEWRKQERTHVLVVDFGELQGTWPLHVEAKQAWQTHLDLKKVEEIATGVAEEIRKQLEKAGWQDRPGSVGTVSSDFMKLLARGPQSKPTVSLRQAHTVAADSRSDGRDMMIRVGVSTRAGCWGVKFVWCHLKLSLEQAGESLAEESAGL
eukprot:g43351.t1